MLKLDDRDLKILAILQKEGRISKTALAERVNLTPAPCWERLKRLENAGIITGYRADVALNRIAPHVVVFMAAELEGHRAENFQLFERWVKNIDEIVGCWAVGGGFDYILQVVAPDIDAYQRLVDQLLEARLGLVRYFTYIVTKPVKQPKSLPIELLAAGETTPQKK
ncbi:Lrp/AsnC family transcriptional regulator [Chelativorans sp. M5D2P16]|uniref:Lrp/AsnC family transcriptional regulator n=1 Tax=Chelativorans sp. M5D2P16 TaxID=3095678 RepID=UPI002ACAFA39|nr:Lrp/AsnC family transcriptional regulator [Chelativorans sp. M5D2P16]MDZ5696795.1 Lrp/AsnC family transcriptional regulator [Chelativorans sp. M5D2P16]